MLTFDHFLPAYAFFFVAGLWALIYWQVSDYLLRQYASLRKRKQKYLQKPKQEKTAMAYKKALFGYWLPNATGTLLIMAITLGCVAWTHRTEQEYMLSLYGGILKPGDAPDPPNPCSRTDRDALKVFIGSNVATSSHEVVPPLVET